MPKGIDWSRHRNRVLGRTKGSSPPPPTRRDAETGDRAAFAFPLVGGPIEGGTVPRDFALARLADPGAVPRTGGLFRRGAILGLERQVAKLRREKQRLLRRPGGPGAQDDDTPRSAGAPPPGTASAKTFALNQIKAYHSDDEDQYKWGTAEDVFADCSALGASVVRQLGSRDGLWSFIGDGEPVPLEGDLQDLIRTEQHAQALCEQLLRAVDEGVQVIVTFFTLGGGATDSYSDFEHSDGTTTIKSGIELSWSRDHEGNTATLSSGTSVTFPSDAAYLSHLDITNAYHCYYLALIAEHFAGLLIDAEALVAGEDGYEDFSLADAVYAIEVFNEIDAVNIIYASGYQRGDSAEYWAYAYLDVVDAMSRVFSGRPGGTTPKCLLPGISSYDVESATDSTSAAYTKTWYWKFGFFEDFVQALIANTPSWDVNDYEAAFGGVDYHWYHRQESADTIGRRHVGWLVYEVAKLRETLDAQANGEGDFSHAVILVTESGVAITTANDSHPAEVEGAGSSATDGYRISQAHEVWRRLCGALVSEADVVGWHSRMSSGSGNFGQMGLREDSSAETDFAGLAYQRRSWHVYQRIASYLKGATSYTLDNPAVDTASEPSFSGVDNVVVFSFYVTWDVEEVGQDVAARPYLYIVLVDPTAAESEYEVTANGSGVAIQLASLPSEATNTVEKKGTELLYEEPAWDASVEHDLSKGATTFTLHAGSHPVVLAAESILTLTPSETS